MGRVLTLLLVLACGGCTRLEHPILAAEGPSLDPALVGEWELSTDEGTVHIDIRAEDGAGVLVMTGGKTGEATRIERYRLITAKLEQRRYASLQSTDPENEARAAWFYYPYDLPNRDLLIIRDTNDEAWREAVKNKMLAGKIEKTLTGTSVTVTAGDAELRAFVLGYGSVMFSDEVLAEFHRVK